MPVDTTGLYFLCPFCNEPFPSANDVRKHVSDTETGDHRNVNGYEMERTIVTTFNPYERLTMEEKILEAAERLDEPLSYDDAEKVSEEADISRNKVLRIWNDSNYELNELHNRTQIKFNKLTDKQQEVLLYYYFNDDLSDNNIKKLTNYADKRAVQNVLNNHKWLLEDEYRPEWVDDKREEYKIDDIENELNNGSEKAENIKLNNIIKAFNECNIDYSIKINIIEEDTFNVIYKLIKNGYENEAEQLINEVDEELVNELSMSIEK